jgi:hypothetical protein
VDYGCKTFQGAKFSIMMKHGPMPEIKKNGFIFKMHRSNRCNDKTGFRVFVSDRYCAGYGSLEMNFMSKSLKIRQSSSILYNFDLKLQQVEIVSFKSRDCSGNVEMKAVYPLGKCNKLGPDSFVTVEK